MLRSLPAAGHPIPPRAWLAIARGEETAGPLFRPVGEPLGHAVVSSGTAGLAVALLALRRRSGRTRVVVPAYTCPSVATAVLAAGLEPVACDLEAGAFGLDRDALAATVDDRTLAVIAVHLFGVPENLDAVRDIAGAAGAAVVEDATQAYGNALAGSPPRPLGTIGDLGVYSFGRGKPLSALAGGLVVANRAEIAGPLREAEAGLEPSGGFAHAIRYAVVLAAYTVLFHPRLYWLPKALPALRLGETAFTPDVDVRTAAPAVVRVANALVRDFAAIRDQRVRKAAAYRDALEGAEGLALPAIPADGVVLLRFPVLVEQAGQRDEVLRRLERAGLGVTGMYPAPLHRLAGLERLGEGTAGFPRADSIASRLLTLPLHRHVRADDVGRIAAAVREAGRRR